MKRRWRRYAKELRRKDQITRRMNLSFIEHQFDLRKEEDEPRLNKDCCNNAEYPYAGNFENTDLPTPLMDIDYDHKLEDMTCGKGFPGLPDAAAQTYTSAGIRAESTVQTKAPIDAKEARWSKLGTHAASQVHTESSSASDDQATAQLEKDDKTGKEPLKNGSIPIHKKPAVMEDGPMNPHAPPSKEEDPAYTKLMEDRDKEQ